jgi:hypothetical protein
MATNTTAELGSYNMASHWKDQAGDHFVIIVGGNSSSGYHYFDPASSSAIKGCSLDNKFTFNESGFLSDVNDCGREEHTYILTSIRRNKE